VRVVLAKMILFGVHQTHDSFDAKWGEVESRKFFIILDIWHAFVNDVIMIFDSKIVKKAMFGPISSVEEDQVGRERYLVLRLRKFEPLKLLA